MMPYGCGVQGPGGVPFMTTAAPVGGTEGQLERDNCGVGSPGITEQRREGRMALGLRIGRQPPWWPDIWPRIMGLDEG